MKSISLIGLMGVGKSSVGRRLANTMRLRFVDSDAEIEKSAGLSIPDIFDLYGEPAFRNLERKVTRRILEDPDRLILATGGGLFMDEELRALILTRTTAIWMRADIDLLLERCARQRSRPLLEGKETPRTVLIRLMAERDPIYALAPITLPVTSAPINEVVETIKRLAHEYWARTDKGKNETSQPEAGHHPGNARKAKGLP